MNNFHQLRNQLGGDAAEPWYIIRRGSKIRALCLRKDLNPRLSFGSIEVWLDARAPAEQWGQRLAAEKMALPVFAADNADADYHCLGLYYVQPRQPTAEELATAEKEASHPVSRIVFLERAHVSEMIFR